MAKCCICNISEGSLKIKEGNPKYLNKPVCKECQANRKSMLESK